jgi:hypothetical protein
MGSYRSLWHRSHASQSLCTRLVGEVFSQVEFQVLCGAAKKQLSPRIQDGEVITQVVRACHGGLSGSLIVNPRGKR